MTVIVAFNDKEHKKIIVGTDSQTTAGQIKYTSDTKMISKEINIVDGFNKKIKTIEILLAITGRAYMKNFIKYGFDAPDMKENIEFIEYLHKEFLPKLTKELSDKKLIQVDNSQADSETIMLVIHAGEIYKLDDNFGVNICSNRRYISVGSGWQVALGSLCTSLKLNPKLAPEVHVSNAIQAAGELTIYCNTDVHMETIIY